MRSERAGSSGCLFPRADHEDADDREDRSDAGHDHRGQDADLAERRDRGAEGGGGEDRAAVGLVEVRAHPGHVAHVVSDVVRDGRRVARVVLGDAGLDLADEVGTDVGGLGVDAATDAGEEGLGWRRPCRKSAS